MVYFANRIVIYLEGMFIYFELGIGNMNNAHCTSANCAQVSWNAAKKRSLLPDFNREGKRRRLRLVCCKNKAEGGIFYNIFHFLGPVACAEFQVWRTKHTHAKTHTGNLHAKKVHSKGGLVESRSGHVYAAYKHRAHSGRNSHTFTHTYLHTYMYIDNCNSRKTLGKIHFSLSSWLGNPIEIFIWAASFISFPSTSIAFFFAAAKVIYDCKNCGETLSQLSSLVRCPSPT